MIGYEIAKPLITKEWKIRLELMKELTQRKASLPLHKEVEKHMASAQNKEKMAGEILKQIRGKTHEDAMKALKAIE